MCHMIEFTRFLKIAPEYQEFVIRAISVHDELLDIVLKPIIVNTLLISHFKSTFFLNWSFDTPILFPQ